MVNFTVILSVVEESLTLKNGCFDYAQHDNYISNLNIKVTKTPRILQANRKCILSFYRPRHYQLCQPAPNIYFL
ncbi:MAG: hypothetical protein HQ522_15195 [Bacteroidetes bacterium]|nr:hypothetical protein [Bacteroidota bacterium]